MVEGAKCMLFYTFRKTHSKIFSILKNPAYNMFSQATIGPLVKCESNAIITQPVKRHSNVFRLWADSDRNGGPIVARIHMLTWFHVITTVAQIILRCTVVL